MHRIVFAFALICFSFHFASAEELCPRFENERPIRNFSPIIKTSRTLIWESDQLTPTNRTDIISSYDELTRTKTELFRFEKSVRQLKVIKSVAGFTFLVPDLWSDGETEVWITDGSPQGTKSIGKISGTLLFKNSGQLDEILATSTGKSISVYDGAKLSKIFETKTRVVSGQAILGGRQYFFVEPTHNPMESNLWVYDGSAVGTKKLKSDHLVLPSHCSAQSTFWYGTNQNALKYDGTKVESLSNLSQQLTMTKHIFGRFISNSERGCFFTTAHPSSGDGGFGFFDAKTGAIKLFVLPPRDPGTRGRPYFTINNHLILRNGSDLKIYNSDFRETSQQENIGPVMQGAELRVLISFKRVLTAVGGKLEVIAQAKEQFHLQGATLDQKTDVVVDSARLSGGYSAYWVTDGTKAGTSSLFEGTRDYSVKAGSGKGFAVKKPNYTKNLYFSVSGKTCSVPDEPMPANPIEYSDMRNPGFWCGNGPPFDFPDVPKGGYRKLTPQISEKSSSVESTCDFQESPKWFTCQFDHECVVVPNECTRIAVNDRFLALAIQRYACEKCSPKKKRAPATKALCKRSKCVATK